MIHAVVHIVLLDCQNRWDAGSDERDVIAAPRHAGVLVREGSIGGVKLIPEIESVCSHLGAQRFIGGGGTRPLVPVCGGGGGDGCGCGDRQQMAPASAVRVASQHRREYFWGPRARRVLQALEP